MSLHALIFDIDGTLAETEEAHLKAFNRVFADANLDWHWNRERYRELLAVSGGKERIRHFITEDEPARLENQNLDEWISDLHRTKTEIYAAMVTAGEIELRPGVERLIREAHQQGLRLAISTTTSMSNVTILFEATLGLDILDWFEVIGASEQASIKKPDPSIYRWVLDQLGLSAEDCLAIEDSSNGLRAASAAHIPVLVTPSFYCSNDDFSGALAVLSDLGEPERPYQQIAEDGNKPGWITPEHLRARHSKFINK